MMRMSMTMPKTSEKQEEKAAEEAVAEDNEGAVKIEAVTVTTTQHLYTSRLVVSTHLPAKNLNFLLGGLCSLIGVRHVALLTATCISEFKICSSDCKL